MTDWDAFDQQFETDAHTFFADSGAAGFGSYTPDAGVGVAFSRRIYVETGVQTLGEFGQVLRPRTVIEFFTADGVLAKGDTLTNGGKTYRLDAIDTDDKSDGIVQRWVVRHV